MKKEEGEGLVPRDERESKQRRRRSSNIQIPTVTFTIPTDALEFIGERELWRTQEEVTGVVREIESGMDLVEAHTRGIRLVERTYRVDLGDITDVTVHNPGRRVIRPALGNGKETKRKKRKK